MSIRSGSMLRHCSFLLLAFASLSYRLSAAEAPPSGLPAEASATPLPADLQAELDALRADPWLPSATLRTSAGWRDNVMLSPFAPIERAFGRAEIEALLLRPMRKQWELVSFLSGDVLRYVSPPAETRGEQQWALHAEGRWQPVAPLRLALKGAGYLRDMVIDLSETEARREIAPTRVRGGYVIGTTRIALPGGFRFEPLAQYRRTDYREFSGDYDEIKTAARIEWQRSPVLALSAAASQARRDFDSRPQYNRGGRMLPGTHLQFQVRDAEVRARTEWMLAGEWSLGVTLGRLENRDEASGYFDYNQKRARLELGWHGAVWRLAIDGEAKRTDYLVQTVGAGIAPPPRISDDFDTMLRVERQLDARWALFAEHRWERSRSNEIEFKYRVTTVQAGVQCEF